MKSGVSRLEGRHLLYAAILRSSGETWKVVWNKINEQLESEGIEPMSFERLVARTKKWMDQHGTAYTGLLDKYLNSLEKPDILHYILVELFTLYEEAKVRRDVKEILDLSKRIQAVVMDIARLQKSHNETTVANDDLAQLMMSYTQPENKKTVN